MDESFNMSKVKIFCDGVGCKESIDLTVKEVSRSNVIEATCEKDWLYRYIEFDEDEAKLLRLFCCHDHMMDLLLKVEEEIVSRKIEGGRLEPPKRKSPWKYHEDGSRTRII